MAAELLDSFKRHVLKRQGLHAEPSARGVLDRAAPPGVGEMVAGDAEQPALGATERGPKAPHRLERRGEGLGGKIDR